VLSIPARTYLFVKAFAGFFSPSSLLLVQGSQGGPTMDMVDRINSCGSFAEGDCPHQALMERLYLIYQIFETGQLLRAKAFCRYCGDWSSRMSLAAGPPDRMRCSNA